MSKLQSIQNVNLRYWNAGTGASYFVLSFEINKISAVWEINDHFFSRQ